MKQIIIGLIKLYQCTKKWRPARCRFYPSCSTYARQAIERHGLLYGLTLSCWRLLRCQPMHAGGVDLVPQEKRI